MILWTTIGGWRKDGEENTKNLPSSRSFLCLRQCPYLLPYVENVEMNQKPPGKMKDCSSRYNVQAGCKYSCVCTADGRCVRSDWDGRTDHQTTVM
jgi:hypothetical protein